MNKRPGRARRRGASFGERFGRFKAETERRLSALEVQARELSGEVRELRSEILDRIDKGFADITKKVEVIDRGQEVSYALADAWMRYVIAPLEEKEALREKTTAAAKAVLAESKENA